MPLTAVVDTNIIVKSLISETSWAAQVFDAFLNGHFILATSDSILQEVHQTLLKPKLQALIRLSTEDIEEIIVLMRSLALLTTDLYEIQAVVSDPDDDKLIACAIEANADYLVTEDKRDLLALKNYQLLDYNVEMIDAERFIHILSTSTSK